MEGRPGVVRDVFGRALRVGFGVEHALPVGLGREVIERGVTRGEVRTDIPPATILATFVGPLCVRLLITDERIDDEFVEAVIDTGLDGARRIPPNKPAPTPPDSQS